MMSKYGILAAALLCLSSPAMAKFEAHEWGTFTSLVGSDGRTQHGMYHEDEKLPGFVYRFGESQKLTLSPLPDPNPNPNPTPRPCPRPSKACFGDEVLNSNLITQKMETPVIYFYSDVRRVVQVNVKFPLGVVTEAYPLPYLTSPKDGPGLKLLNGDTTFRVNILATTVAKLQDVSETNIYSHARKVPESNIVASGQDREKFIFYRGLGQFNPRLKIQSRTGNLELYSPKGFEVPAAFLVHVGFDGKYNIKALGNVSHARLTVSAAEIAELSEHRTDSDENLGEQLMLPEMLKAGLTHAEAKAMLDTWKHGYMRVPGLRLLYLLPRSEVEEILPLVITPAPTKLERVFIGRLEILTDTEEERILKQVLLERENFSVASLGRFSESILRRVLQVASGRKETTKEDFEMIGQLVLRAARLETL